MLRTSSTTSSAAWAVGTLDSPDRRCSSISATMRSATEKVAARIVELRQERAISQQALAKKAGINRVTLARLERAMHPPSLDTLDHIARALGVKLADLFK